VPAFPQPDPGTLADAAEWRLVSATTLGDDVRLEYEPGGD
jgi:riboflavin biosynthesis pyrimidine reductase